MTNGFGEMGASPRYDAAGGHSDGSPVRRTTAPPRRPARHRSDEPVEPEGFADPQPYTDATGAFDLPGGFDPFAAAVDSPALPRPRAFPEPHREPYPQPRPQPRPQPYEEPRYRTARQESWPTAFSDTRERRGGYPPAQWAGPSRDMPARWEVPIPHDAPPADFGSGAYRAARPTRPAPPAGPRTPARPRRRRRSTLVLSAVLVMLLGAAGYVGYRLLATSTPSAPLVTSAAPPSLPPGDPIADQKTDPAQLTAAEVFGGSTIPSSAAGGSYSVVKSEEFEGCAGVATGEITSGLEKLDCTQTVRATIMSPDGAYVITAGIVNLPTTSAAADARATIKTDIAAGSGRISGYDAGGPTTVITRVATRAAWDERGHYLVYAVIARTDGQLISSSDDRVPLIVTDIVENYLSGTVLKARETPQPSPS